MRRAFRYAIVLDFEATCDDVVQPRPQEIIEFPSVLMDLETHCVIDEFESFVRPHHHPALTPFCTELTSITQAQVDGAPPFGEVLQRHGAWLDSHALSQHDSVIVTCGDWDLLRMLPAQLRASAPAQEVRPIYERWLNVKRAFCAVQKVAKAPGLKGMLSALGLPLEGRHHRGIDDCRNIARLLATLLKAGASAEPTGSISKRR